MNSDIGQDFRPWGNVTAQSRNCSNLDFRDGGRQTFEIVLVPLVIVVIVATVTYCTVCHDVQ